MSDLICREDAIDAILNLTNSKTIDELSEYIREHDLAERWSGGVNDAIDAVVGLPSAQPEQRWNKLMMYLADLQLTYSPGWGANGQGDEKLYEFVSGLIEELREWEEGEQE